LEISFFIFLDFDFWHSSASNIVTTGLNFPGRDDIGVLMKPGLVFTIEPIIIQLGKNGRVPQLYMLEDNWTVRFEFHNLPFRFCFKIDSDYVSFEITFR
jgi:hypothetical protein